jgi:hypothetical protein
VFGIFFKTATLGWKTGHLIGFVNRLDFVVDFVDFSVVDGLKLNQTVVAVSQCV